MRKKREIEAVIERVDYPNIAVVSDKTGPVYGKGGIEGQKIRVRLGKKKEVGREGKTVEVLEKSPLEHFNGCTHQEVCGGCTYQSISYEAEEQIKIGQMKRLFKDVANDIEPVFHKNPKPVGYRNKMEYTFGDEWKGGPLTLGLHKKNRFYEIIDNDGCNLVHPDMDRIRQWVQGYFRENKEQHYHKIRKVGTLRHLIVRYAMTSGEIMVNLVTTSEFQTDPTSFVKGLLSLETEGQIVSILHTVNDQVSDAVICDRCSILYGKDNIIEELFDLTFEISAFSFFQPNVFGIKNLYQRVFELAENLPQKEVLDLYSGTGTISQIMALQAKHVTGIELVEEAVEKARKNAEKNDKKNITFIAGDVLYECDRLEIKPDLIILDPPRGGIHPKALPKIIEYGANEIIYISCNPKSMVEDLKKAKEAGYQVESIDVFDQFTRTPHMEAVVLLSKLDVDQHIDVKIDMDELDITAAESKATYEEIKEYILEKFKFKVSTLYIAQVKRKCGTQLRDNYNISKKENQKVPQCPPEKEEAILDALKHFKMI